MSNDNFEAPKGFSLEDILSEVRASKEREKLQDIKQKEIESYEEMQRRSEESRIKAEEAFRLRIEAEEKARVEAEVRAKLETEERQRLARLEKEARRKAEESRKEAEEKAKAEAEAELKRQAEARRKIEEEIRRRAETEYREKLEAEYRAKLEESIRKKEEEVERERKKLEEETRIKTEMEYKARLEAEYRAELTAREELLRKQREAETRRLEEERQQAILERALKAAEAEKREKEKAENQGGKLKNSKSADEMLNTNAHVEPVSQGPRVKYSNTGFVPLTKEEILNNIKKQSGKTEKQIPEKEPVIIKRNVNPESQATVTGAVVENVGFVERTPKKKFGGFHFPGKSKKNEESQESEKASLAVPSVDPTPFAKRVNISTSGAEEKLKDSNENLSVDQNKKETSVPEDWAKTTEIKMSEPDKLLVAEEEKINIAAKEGIFESSEKQSLPTEEKEKTEEKPKRMTVEEKLLELDRRMAEKRAKVNPTLTAEEQFVEHRLSENKIKVFEVPEEENDVIVADGVSISENLIDKKENPKATDPLESAAEIGKNEKDKDKDLSGFSAKENTADKEPENRKKPSLTQSTVNKFEQDTEDTSILDAKKEMEKDNNHLGKAPLLIDQNPFAEDVSKSLFSDGSIAHKNGATFNKDEAIDVDKLKNGVFQLDPKKDKAVIDNLKGRKGTNIIAWGEDEGKDDPIPYGLSEYINDSEAPRIRTIIDKVLSKLSFSAMTATFFTIIALILNLTPVFGIELPGILSFINHPIWYLITNLILIVLTVSIFHGEVADGIKSIIKVKFDSSASSAVGLILAFIYNGLAIGNSGKIIEGVQVLTFLPIFIITVSIFTKYLNLLRIRNNFDFIINHEKVFANFDVPEKSIIDFIEDSLKIRPVELLGSRPTGFVNRFFEISFKDDENKKLTHKMLCLSFAGSIVTFIVALVLGFGLMGAVGACLAVCMLSTPVFISFATAFQLFRSGRIHAQFGAAITGTEVVSKYAKTNAMIINSNELFYEGSVNISGIKFFDNAQTEEVIKFAASATAAAKSPLASMLLNVLQGDAKSLPQVDSVTYKDEMGLTATIEGRTVLVGNRELMAKYAISVPSKEVEERVEKGVRNIVYISIDGSLSAMLAVVYNFDDSLLWQLRAVNLCGVSFAVLTSDPNITPQFLELGMKLRRGSVVIMPSKFRTEYVKSQKEKEIDAEIVHDGSFSGYVTGITGAMRLLGNLKLLRVLQVVITILGIIVPLLFFITGGFAAFGVIKITIMYLGIIAAYIAVPLLRRC